MSADLPGGSPIRALWSPAPSGESGVVHDRQSGSRRTNALAICETRGLLNGLGGSNDVAALSNGFGNETTAIEDSVPRTQTPKQSHDKIVFWALPQRAVRNADTSPRRRLERVQQSSSN